MVVLRKGLLREVLHILQTLQGCSGRSTSKGEDGCL